MRQLWQYKTIKLETKGFMGGVLDINVFDEKLNLLGEQGWELVTSFDTNMSQGGSRDVIATFKRPRES
jgi:hypothetical protein